ncbi:MAG: hypothetical protein PVI57_16920 [Gemmatimonadota bacterium]
MKRRRFVGTVAMGTLGVGLLNACRDPRPGRERPTFELWTWVHGGRDRTGPEWGRHFARLRRAGFRGVLVGGGDLDVLSETARSEGLELHRWIWTLNRNGDTRVREEHPEWFTVSRSGRSSLTHPPYVDYYRWVCPTREPVRAYLRDLVDRLAADPRVDGVHLDYVRHCDVILPRGLWEKYDLVQDTELPEFDFCYCDVCRDTFREQAGRDPMELGDDAPYDQGWRRFRRDGVTRLVEELTDAAHARGKPITAAVFPTPSIARRLVRQAWDDWPVDAVFPMLYHGFYLEGLDWIGWGVREGRGPGVRPGVLRAGLYLPDLDPGSAARAVAIARDAGADGAAFFESNGLTEEHLERVGEGVG